MAKEQLKPKKGVVVTEINGVKYFKLQSNYTGDYTKNCGLLGTEIDENFYFLRSNDIDKMSVKNGILTLTRVDGGTLSADISMPYTFNFDEKTGKLIITDGNGDVQVLEGFVVEGKDVRVATDATLNGDGTKGNPLRISELEKTGTYAPANEFLDMAVYTYFELVRELLDDGTEIYHYEERMKNQVPEGADVIEYSEKPTKDLNFESPRWIKVRKDINLPDASKLGAGYRIVTRESKDNFGLLYNYDGVKKIQAALDTTGSLWRIPTRRDWALMLNAAEYCEEDRDHDTKYVNEWTGKNAGARAKATTLWMLSNRQEKGLPVAGEDSLPIAGTNKFTVYPVGYADGSRGADDKDFDLEAFTKKSSFWSITPTDCNGEKYSSNIFTRTFAYDTRKVLQESSKPSSRMSIRLVKDFEPGQMNANEIENILGYDMPVVLLTNDETGYSKLWTSINVGFSEEQYDGVYSKEWSAATGSERGHEIVYYINVWDGKEWHKKQMNEGDSIVLLNGGKDESGNTIYNHEWRIYSGETEPMLIDTAKAIKGEFQKEIDELNEKVDDLSDITKELSTVTKETKENLENEINRAKSAETALRKDIDDLSAFTETAEDNVNDLVNDIIGVEGNVVSGFAMPNFYGAYWKDIDKSEYDAAPNDEKEHIHGSEIPSAAEWHEEHPSINYIELFDDSVEPHVYKYVKLETDAHYISDAENIIDAIEKLDGAISEAVGDIMVKKLDEPAPDMLASYVLLVGDEQKGDRINIPKDDVQAFHEVKVGHSGATINSETGEIIDGPYADHEVLIISYLNSEHVYKLVEIDLEDIIIENEFKDGFNIEGHEVKVKIDDASEKVIVKYDENENVTEKVLSVSPDGVKVSHIQDAIDAAVAEETERAEEAEQALDEKIEAETARAQSAETALQEDIDAEIDRSKRIDENIAKDLIGVSGKYSGDTENGFALDFFMAEYVETDESHPEATVMDHIPGYEEIMDNDYLEDPAMKYINFGGFIYELVPSTNYISNANNVYEALTALDNKAKETSDGLDNEIARAVARENEIDQKVDDEIARATEAEAELQENIEDEIARATEKENSIQSELDLTQAGAGLESDGSYRTIENANYISEASSLRDADAKLDVALKSESDRATAAENSISGAVTTLSGIVSTFSAKTDGEISRLDAKIETETTRATTAENGLNDRVSTLENVTIIGEKAINVDKSTANENKVITLVIDSDNKVLSQSNNGLKTTLGLNYDSVNKKIQLTGIDGAVLSEFNSSDFVKDGMIDSVVFDPTTKKLTITWNTDAGKESTVIDLTSLTDVYTVAEDSKNYLAINDYVVSAKVGVENGLAKQNDYVALKDRVDLMESGYTTPGSIKHTISDLMITNATEGSNIDAGKSLMRHYAVDGEKYYYASSNAKDMFYGDKVLSTALSDIETSISNLSGSSETIISAITDTINNFSASTVQEFNRISGAVNTEIERATAAENSISGNVNTLSASVVTLSSTTQAIQSELDATQTGAGLNSDGGYIVKETANYISTATSLANADMILDGALKSESDRATAAENVISGAVVALSGVVETITETLSGSTDEIQAELDATQAGAGLNADGTYHKHNTAGDMGNYISNATSLDDADMMLDNALKTESNRATAAEEELRGLITDSTTKVSELSAATETFSANTVSGFAKVDKKIDAETDRATAAEKSISGDVDTLKDSIKTFSGATVDEIARLDAQSKKNKVKSTGNTIVVTEATEGTNLDVNIDNKTILSNNDKLKTGLKVMPLAAGELEANVREAFRLVDNEGTPVDGTTIKIYKSSSLVSVELISKDDIDYVRITYIDNSGDTKTMDLNIQQLIFESEFKDGLVVNEKGEVRVKIDPASENFLTVSSEGVKVSGLQNAINAAVEKEKIRATAAEDAISSAVTESTTKLSELSAATISFSGATVAKIGLMESGWNVPGSIKHTLEDTFVTSVTGGSAEDANKSLMRYYNDGAEHKYYASSNANDMYYDGLPLSTVIKTIEDKITQPSIAIDKLSGATIAEIARVDKKIDNEETRATAAEKSISGTVNTLKDSTEKFSAATVNKFTEIDGKIDSNNTRLNELSASTIDFSGATVAEIKRVEGEDIASDDPYEISATNGLILKRKNGNEITISFDGNFGASMPTPLG